MARPKSGKAGPRAVIESDGKPVDRGVFLAGAIHVLQEIHHGIAAGQIMGRGADEVESDLAALIRDIPRLAPESTARESRLRDAVLRVESELIALKVALGGR